MRYGLRGAAAQWLVVAVLVLLLVTLARLHPEWFANPETRYPEEPARIGRYDAIDGDSFRLGKREIRLHGIDAPEYRQTCTTADGAAVPCGKMARDALTRLARNGEVACALVEYDRYRREVSECTAGKTNLNREMVRQGWAVAYTKHLGTDPYNIAGAEAEAKAAKRGIWAMRFDRPEVWRNRNRNLQGNMGGVATDEIKDE